MDDACPAAMNQALQTRPDGCTLALELVERALHVASGCAAARLLAVMRIQ